MTKARKNIVHTTRKVKRAGSVVKNIERKLGQARREEHNAAIEAQIAEVQAGCDAEIAAIRARNHDFVPLGSFHTDLIASMAAQMAAMEERIALLQGKTADGEEESPPRATALPAPQNVEVELLGGTRLRVRWEPVDHASGYSVRYSTNATFAGEVSWSYVDPDATTRMLYDLKPETTYYVGVRAFGTGDWQDSNYSASQTITTGAASGGGGGDGAGGNTVEYLKNWFDTLQAEFQNVSELLPQLDNTVLTTVQRRRLLGSGVRRYGFIDKVSDTAADYPQFWPASVHGADASFDIQDKLKERLREIEVLRSLMVWLRYVLRVVGDLQLLAGDDAFRMANVYYASVRTAARSNLPEAKQVFQLLQLFWGRRRRKTDEPTLPTELFGRSTDIERDFHGVLHGTKDGTVSARRESPTPAAGGVLEVLDDVHGAKCRVRETPTP